MFISPDHVSFSSSAVFFIVLFGILNLIFISYLAHRKCINMIKYFLLGMTIKTHRPLPLRPTESSSDKNADKKYAFLSRETRADYRPMEVSGRFVGQLLVNHYMLSLLFLPCLGIGLSWVFSYILENLCLCSVFVL